MDEWCRVAARLLEDGWRLAACALATCGDRGSAPYTRGWFELSNTVDSVRDVSSLHAGVVL